jgi:hypothetical protein
MENTLRYRRPFDKTRRDSIPPTKRSFMTTTKPTPITISSDYVRLPLEGLVPQANNVYTHLKDNSTFPNSPVDLTVFKTTIDNLSTWIVYAQDGGKKAIAERNRLGQEIVKMDRQLAHYVLAVAKDDPTIVASSGFTAVPVVRKVTAPANEFVRSVKPGKNSGQMEVVPVSSKNAYSYQVRAAKADATGTPGSWTEYHMPTARPALVINSLTPGATYLFQVRVLLKSGFTDWSDSVTRICI